MSDFQRRVGAWADSVFVESTPASIVAHLRREVDELRAAVVAPYPGGQRPGGHRGYPRPADETRIAEEAADCYLLLLHLAHRIGFDLAACAGAGPGASPTPRAWSSTSVADPTDACRRSWLYGWPGPTCERCARCRAIR